MKNFCLHKSSPVIVMIIILFAATLNVSAFYKELKYPVTDIPPELKQNAKAVIRNESYELAIVDIRNASLIKKYAITILNENALSDAILVEWYNKFTRIHNISGAVYDANGEKVETLRLDDIIDHSAITYSTVFDDSRLKYYEPKYRTYPFTVEYQYEIKYNGYLDLPEWIPCSDNNISVQASTFKITTSDSVTFRYLNRNTDIKPEILKVNDQTVYLWKMENLPAFIEEPWCESMLDYCPAVFFAPDKFELENFEGDMKNWKSFGLWISSINKGRDRLTDETTKYLQELVKDCPDDYQKSKKIYEYLQKKTRYVSIQVGIGGWRPFEAETVDRLGYGDCKGLTNYYKAMLAAVGIQSFYTLVLAGTKSRGIMADFPSQQFNHAILCLPVDGDTLWVECTNPHIPFGYNGTFTDDRDVLIITDEGGKIIRTNIYGSKESVRTGKSELRIDVDGNAELISKRNYGGYFYDEMLPTTLMDYENQKKRIFEELTFPGVSLNTFNYEVVNERHPLIKESLDLFIPNLCNPSGARTLLQVNRFTPGLVVPKRVSNRKSPVTIKRSYVALDTVVIIVPENYDVESLPKPIGQTSDFGNCQYSCTIHDKTITFIRRLQINKGTYPASAYPALIDFFKNVSFQDASKMSLIKKAG